MQRAAISWASGERGRYLDRKKWGSWQSRRRAGWSVEWMELSGPQPIRSCPVCSELARIRQGRLRGRCQRRICTALETGWGKLRGLRGEWGFLQAAEGWRERALAYGIHTDQRRREHLKLAEWWDPRSRLLSRPCDQASGRRKIPPHQTVHPHRAQSPNLLRHRPGLPRADRQWRLRHPPLGYPYRRAATREADVPRLQRP